MAKMPLEQTYQSNDLGDQEDALIFRPELPPRAANTVQRSPPHVSNQNVFAVLVKNRRQITSLTAGLIVLLGSGVHTVWAFWELFYPSPPRWLETEVIVLVGSWYIATIIGCAIAATLIPKWSKKNLYTLSAIFLLLSSLLFIARLYTEMRIRTVLFSGRFLAGLANGIAYLTVITHAAENAVNQIRGVILRGIGYVLAFSLFIAGLTTNGTIGNDIQAEWISGFLNLFYSILALVLAPLLTIESVPYLMQKANDGRSVSEREALVIKTMVKLRNERGETPKIRHDFIEMKHHLNEDQLDSRNPFNRRNLRPLWIIIGVRILSVCAKNLPFTLLIMLYFNHMNHSGSFSLYQLLLLLSCRFIFGMFAMFFIDKFERKKYLYIFSILCGIWLLFICIYKREDIMNTEETYLYIGIIIYFIFASMSIDCVGHVQTSEAFSYATKSMSISIAHGIEHLIHMTFIVIFKFEYNILTFVLIAIGLIVMGLSTLLTVPAKTKGLSLRQTRDIYRNTQYVSSTETA